jgi:hypothetical protein
MRGDIDEIMIPVHFSMFVQELNIAGATGKQYVILHDSDDKQVALNTQNILSVRERDDEATMLGNA